MNVKNVKNQQFLVNLSSFQYHGHYLRDKVINSRSRSLILPNIGHQVKSALILLGADISEIGVYLVQSNETKKKRNFTFGC